MIKLIHTTTVIERYTPCGFLDADTLKALKAAGFEWKAGSWHRTRNEWKETTEDVVLMRQH